MDFKIIVYTTLVFSVLFLAAGLILMIFGRRIVPNEGAARVEIEVLGNTVSTPYQASFILAILGVILLYMTHSFYANIDERFGASATKFSLINRAYAQDNLNQISDGWTYFGYEKNPNIWNFSFVVGDFSSMISGQKTILKSKNHLNVRINRFEDFTGTILGFLNPAPKIIGDLKVGECILIKSAESVGFSKIWVEFERVECD